ncbi:MAG TPA: hypothetical protein VFM74_08485 [Candidatus Limnocylindria bacterium]|nr:hypothetical protein [Candidatus Limnocylindria bacterium]
MTAEPVEHMTDWSTEAARLSHLLVVEPYFGAADALRVALDRASGWLGPIVDDAPSGVRRHVTDLRLRVGDQPGRATFRKAAYVDIGRIRRVSRGYEVEISWRAATLAPLFPVFSGKLAIADGELRLEGWYAPPGGAIGFVADRALLNVAARRTGRWFLDELVEAADAG